MNELEIVIPETHIDVNVNKMMNLFFSLICDAIIKSINAAAENINVSGIELKKIVDIENP